MLQLVLKRVLNAVLLLATVLVLNFTLIHLAPGDPAEVIAGEMGGATEEILAAIRQQYGLDQPFHIQLGRYLGQVLQGDLGYSYYFNTSVIGLIGQRLPATLVLVITAALLSIVTGTLLGVVAARRPNGLLSHFTTIISLVGYSAPVFWTGLVLLILFASMLPWFPVSGMNDILLKNPSWWIQVWDVLHHLVLPAFTLAIIYIAQYSRLARASMLEVLGADYIRTAHAKGLSADRVVYKHGLRNAILPVITAAGLQFGNLFAGAVLVETVFNWPGLGSLAFDSILRRDYPTMLGILFFSAFMVTVANLLTDVAYGVADPRIRKR
ncbi:MAG: ABC transporter permease [bacterium]|jgi:peptide/nickel transport system permease protein